MGQGRFLNQKLGKRKSRTIGLLKSHLAGGRPIKSQDAMDRRLPKKGFSREERQR